MIDPKSEVQDLKKKEALAALVALRAQVNEAIDRLERELFFRQHGNRIVRAIRRD